MTAAFDPLRILQVLQAHHVDFLVIGGIAGRLWGSTTVTNDLDVCYSRKPANLSRLADALGELGARLRGVGEELPFVVDERALAAGDTLTLTTTGGFLDILATPTGTRGFDDLIATCEQVALGDLTINVTALEDLIRMKRAAGRPKDLIELEVLGAVRDERSAEERLKRRTRCAVVRV